MAEKKDIKVEVIFSWIVLENNELVIYLQKKATDKIKTRFWLEKANLKTFMQNNDIKQVIVNPEGIEGVGVSV